MSKPDTRDADPNKPSGGKLHQMTMGYEPAEDRMLLRISTTAKLEYRLYLTRRFVKVLWGGLTKILERHPDIKADLMPKVKEAVVAMRHQEAVQTADFSQDHVKDNRNLMSNTGPQLVTGAKVHGTKSGHTVMSFQTSFGSDVNISLNEQLLHAFCHMVITTATKAEWDLELTMGDGNVVVPTEGAKHLH